MGQPSTTDRDRCLQPSGQWLQVVMHRRGHRWMFRWEPGAEEALIDHLVTLVGSKDAPLDWFDVIAIYHHVIQYSTTALPTGFDRRR